MVQNYYTLSSGKNFYDLSFGLPNVFEGLPPGWSVIGKSFWNGDQGRVAVATAGTYATYRILWKNDTGKTVRAIALNFVPQYKSGATEAYLGNAIRVKAAIEVKSAKDTTATRVTVGKFTFQGQRTALCDQILSTDPLAVMIPNGYYAYIDVAVTVDTNGHFYPRGSAIAGGTNFWGVNNGEAQDTSNDVADSGAMSAQTGAPIFGPMNVVGWFADGTTASSVAVLGDSIVLGTGDGGWSDTDYGAPNKGGWAVRAIVPSAYGMCKGAFGSEAFSHLAGFLASAPFGSLRCQGALACSHILLAYGANDLGSGLATYKTNVQKVVAWFLAHGKRVGVPTVLPQPSSSNGFVDYAGQTPDTGTNFGNSATRLSVNAWLRDTTATGAKAMCEAYAVSTYGSCPGSMTVLDVCSGYERNVSGVATLDAGYIPADSITNSRTGTAAASSSNSVIKDSLMTTNAYRALTLQMTSGACSGQTRGIQYNNTTDIVPETPFNGTVNAGETYKIHNGSGQNDTASSQCVHPASKGHERVASACSAALLAWLGS